MLFEYAVEPKVMATWNDFRYFLDQFGTGQGRLIANYPKNWGQLVWDACEEADPVKRKKIEVRLTELRQKTVSTRRLYSPADTWIQNALAAHQVEPFHGILVKSECAHGDALQSDEIDATNPLWKAEPDGSIARQALEIARLAGPLLRHSTEVLFVDQHYSALAKHGRPLSALIDQARRGKALVSIEYHLNAAGSADHFSGELDRQRRFFRLQANEKIVFVRWRCIDGGENQHPRYILTNRGGICFDYGLDEGEGTTDWHRLSEKLWQQRRQQYHPGSTIFDLVDAWQVTTNEVTRVKWESNCWLPI